MLTEQGNQRQQDSDETGAAVLLVPVRNGAARIGALVYWRDMGGGAPTEKTELAFVESGWLSDGLKREGRAPIPNGLLQNGSRSPQQNSKAGREDAEELQDG